MNIKTIGHRALKKTALAALLLGSVNAAHATMTLVITWDYNLDVTTITASGSWDTFVNPLLLPAVNVPVTATPNSAADLFGDIWFSSGDAMVSVGPFELPSFDSTGSVLERSGASWAFAPDGVYAQAGYVAGDYMTTTSKVAGDIAGINADFPLLKSGTYVGGGNQLDWTMAVVPETSSYSLIAGALALGVIGVRRRRG